MEFNIKTSSRTDFTRVWLKIETLWFHITRFEEKCQYSNDKNGKMELRHFCIYFQVDNKI